MIPDSILEVKNLKVHFNTDEGELRAVNGVSFNVPRGKVLGIVGESGCGKSVTSYATMRLVQKPGRIVGGSIMLHPRDEDSFDVLTLHEKSKRLLDVRGKLASMVFQEPMTALSPVHTIGNQICEAILMHRDVSKGQAEKRAIEMLAIHGIDTRRQREERVREMLRRVGLKPEHGSRYPHAFSGGQRQRIGIARALIMHPRLVICDEAVSALDVSVQAQVINLLRQLQREMGLTYIFIAHDLSVVKHICDRVGVMYAGQIVELAETQTLFANPRHPYTKALLSAVPNPDPDVRMDSFLEGEVADTGTSLPGCAFHPRCPVSVAACRDDVPELLEHDDGRLVSCHLCTHKPIEESTVELSQI